jgi:hypothetical protein
MHGAGRVGGCGEYSVVLSVTRQSRAEQGGHHNVIFDKVCDEPRCGVYNACAGAELSEQVEPAADEPWHVAHARACAEDRESSRAVLQA